MKYTLTLPAVLILLLIPTFLTAQNTPEEIARFEYWEKWLSEAKITGGIQLDKRFAVTEPWVINLEKDGITQKALWKNPQGRLRGYIEGWKWEIAAYKLSNHLGVFMIPPTVEKRYKGNLGSCQLWKGNCRSLREIMQGVNDKSIKIPGRKRAGFFRALSLQRAFDNLIANEDRHQNQYLVTEDWRMLLVDHSRSFRTSKKFTRGLIYNEKHKDGLTMKDMPRLFFQNLKSLTFDSVREVVGKYLTDVEISALLERRDLIVAWVEKRIEEAGEKSVLYD
jgi:hypothetical protein